MKTKIEKVHVTEKLEHGTAHEAGIIYDFVNDIIIDVDIPQTITAIVLTIKSCDMPVVEDAKLNIAEMINQWRNI